MIIETYCNSKSRRDINRDSEKVNIKPSLIFIYFFVFSLLFVFFLPVFNGPDEDSHLKYINYVSQNLSLPNLAVPEKTITVEGQQHPLYYIVCAILVRCFVSDNSVDVEFKGKQDFFLKRGEITREKMIQTTSSFYFPDNSDKRAYYFLRILSIIVGLLNLFLIFKLSKLFFPNSKWAIAPLLLVAVLPQFSFNSSTITNDGLSNLFATLTIYFMVLILKTGPDLKKTLWLGLFLGLGILAKKSILFLVPVVFVLFLYLFFKEDEPSQRRKILSYVGLIILILIVLTSAFFIRNLVIYGELLGNNIEKEILQSEGLVQKKSILSSYFIHPFIASMFMSSVGSFGYYPIRLPMFVYLICAIFLLIGCVGLYLHLKKVRFDDMSLYFSFGTVVFLLGSVIYYNLTYSQPQGRYMFPVIGLIAVLLCLGFKEIVSRIKDKIKRTVVIGLSLSLLIVFDVLSLFVLILFFRMD